MIKHTPRTLHVSNKGSHVVGGGTAGSDRCTKETARLPNQPRPLDVPVPPSSTGWLELYAVLWTLSQVHQHLQASRDHLQSSGQQKPESSLQMLPGDFAAAITFVCIMSCLSWNHYCQWLKALGIASFKYFSVVLSNSSKPMQCLYREQHTPTRRCHRSQSAVKHTFTWQSCFLMIQTAKL